VIEVNATNINKFIQDTPSVPKCLLFTDKPGFPLIYRALSVSFDVKYKSSNDFLAKNFPRNH
jgi:hypothetical protein